MATRNFPPVRTLSIQAKYILFFIYGVLLVIVWITRDHLLLDANSFLRQRYAPIPLLMILHGVPGTIALLLGTLQFSSRLRQRYIQVHRVLGWIYVVSTAITAPAAIFVAIRLPIPTLLPASIIQALGWLLATGTAIYCVRTGRIQQHREWMMRGYPFAMVFVFVRAITAIPSIAVQGPSGAIPVVWSVIAIAGLLPSFLIEWQHLAANRRMLRVKPAATAARSA